MSGMEEDIQLWLRYAEADMVAAEALHGIGQELNAIFHLQQAVEKTVKARFIKETGTLPPRLHNLHALGKECGLQLNSEQSQLLEELTTSYTQSRYPEQLDDFLADVSGEETAKLIAASKEFITWLRQQL